MPENSITVTINNRESVTVDMIPGNPFSVEMDFQNTLDIIQISLKTEKAFVPKDEGWNDDTRELGTMITSWSLSDEKNILLYNNYENSLKRFARKLKFLYNSIKNP